MFTDSQISKFKLKAKLENIKGFSSLLKAINFVETAIFIWSDDGLKIIVEDSQCLQAIAYISSGCFKEYKLQSAQLLSFCINLSVITDCLSIFPGTDCNMTMLYNGEGSSLILLLEQYGEENLVTKCSIKTKYVNQTMEFSFEDDEIENLIILRCADFSNLLHEILKSTEELSIFLSPVSPYFRITVINNNMIDSNIEIANTSDMIYTFNCKLDTIKKYKFSYIKNVMKSFNLGLKVSLRTNKTGLLGIQVLIKSEGSAQTYIEYFISPLFDDGDIEE